MTAGMTLTLYKSHVHWSGAMQWWACSSLMTSPLPCDSSAANNFVGRDQSVMSSVTDIFLTVENLYKTPVKPLASLFLERTMTYSASFWLRHCLASGLFHCWCWLRNNNMATNFKRDRHTMLLFAPDDQLLQHASSLKNPHCLCWYEFH